MAQYFRPYKTGKQVANHRKAIAELMMEEKQRKINNMRNESATGGCLIMMIWLIFAMAWLINVVKFVQCDFKESYKEEVIHGVGIVFAPTAIVTVWYNK